MNRRDLITAGRAAGLTPPALETGAAETPVALLFRQWSELEGTVNGEECEGLSDDDMRQMLDSLTDIERALMAEPALSASDVLMKIIAFTGYGTFQLGGVPWFDEVAFWQEASRFAGFA